VKRKRAALYPKTTENDLPNQSHTIEVIEPEAKPEHVTPVKTQLNITEIQRILPHRYPFLLIDRVIEITPKKRIVAIKNVTVNEPFFQGHFPGYPIMPGVLMIEAIAQTGAALLLTEIDEQERQNKLTVFTGIERAKFRRPVTPGDQLRIVVEVLAWRRTAVRMQGKAYVGDKIATEAVVTCQLVPRRAETAPGETKPE
jgi:3-hydroxyacyl-[acyl-carrier-protein] dehydratase